MIHVIIVLILIGVGLYLINTYVPMAQPIKTILNVVVIVLVILWVLTLFGFDVPIPNLDRRRG
jgi:hypothetical protein